MNVQNFLQNSNYITVSSVQKRDKKPEFIDKILGAVKNQDDINDCVAVPRGIFKAYLWIMSGFGLLGISGALPSKLAKTKSVLNIVGNICNIVSAFYFAKGFAFKGVSPTVKMKDINTGN